MIIYGLKMYGKLCPPVFKRQLAVKLNIVRITNKTVFWRTTFNSSRYFVTKVKHIKNYLYLFQHLQILTTVHPIKKQNNDH